MADTLHTCDACGHEVSGYTKNDLQADGWQWHDIGKDRWFVICGDCERVYEQRRTARAMA